MDLDTDDEVLRALSVGGQMNYEQWPSLFSRLIPRLERIVHEEFPIPNIPQQPTIPSSQPTQDASASTEEGSQSSSQSTNKENAPPAAIPGTLPPKLLALLGSITSTLTSLFSKYPPHTIQRLAELILNPKQHYRTLPSYLHALDRVVHVTSGAQVFPLPPAIPDPSSATVLSNGTLASGADPLSISWGNPATAPPQTGLGSDESLGGALLTPITWLTKSNGTHSPLEGEVKTESTEMVDGPNGPGGVETVSVSVNGVSSHRDSKDASGPPSSDTAVASLRAEGGVTQGELLRQEQRAGVVPAAQLHGHRADSDGMGEEDEMPHARGPDEIGMEDMGPQGGSTTQRGGPGMGMQGINVEAAIGRRLNVKKEEEEEKKIKDEAMSDVGSDGSHTPKRVAEDEQGGDGKRIKEEVIPEDTEIADADEKTQDEPKLGEKGETKGADAVDTSSV